MVDGESEVPLPTDQVKMMPGSRPYARLAKFGYLVSAAYALGNMVLLTVLRETGFTFGWVETLVSAVVTIVLSVAWFQLGRKQEVSWFLAAGVFGGVSAVLGLIINLEPLPAPVASGTFVAISMVEAIIFLVYFATQLLAFYTAAKRFRVKFFMYAAYLLVIGTVASPVVGAALVASTATQQPVVGETFSYLAYGIALLISAATALAASAGFHRFGRISS